LLLDPDRSFAVGTAVGRVGDVVEGAAIRHQRVGEVAPRPLRHRGGKFHRRAVRALPGHQRAVREHRPVAQRGQRHRDPAAIGGAGGADPARLGDPFVGKQGDQVLGVANFVAIIHQVVVAVGAGWVNWQFFRVVAAAGFAPAAVAHAEDRIAVLRPPLGLTVEADLFPAPAMEVADQRVRPVGPRRGRGRQDYVDVDLGPVPGFGSTAAETDVAVACLSRTGKIASVEAREVGTRQRRQGQRRQQQGCDRSQNPSHVHPHSQLSQGVDDDELFLPRNPPSEPLRRASHRCYAAKGLRRCEGVRRLRELLRKCPLAPTPPRRGARPHSFLGESR
jgi:hypothetical protein